MQVIILKNKPTIYKKLGSNFWFRSLYLITIEVNQHFNCRKLGPSRREEEPFLIFNMFVWTSWLSHKSVHMFSP